MVAQAFYTLALMHGGIGSPGHFMSWNGLYEGSTGSVAAGDATNAAGNPINPLTPPGFMYMFYPIPTFAAIEDQNSWEVLDHAECWEDILNGEYGRDIWPGGKKKIDIHQIYVGGYANSLNQLPNANAGIKAFRSVDFVWGANPYFDPSRQYCDIVLPIATWWEKANLAYGGTAEVLYWYDRILEPMFESKTEGFVAEELARRLGVDPKTVNTLTDEERTYASLAGATYLAPGATEAVPLITIGEKDIKSLGVKGIPQDGVVLLDEFKSKGCFKVPHGEEKLNPAVPYAAYYADPEGSPLNTASGKFEIYCASLAYAINTVGFSTISPIAKWQIGDPEQGQGTQTDEYPLLLWTPHSLRRAHSVNDNVTSLREAFPQECFISKVDAEARDIHTGDHVLMSSPYGKVLRVAKVMPTLVPGAVAIQDGAWIRMDEETGIDLGGCPNILQAPKTSGQACTPWTGTLVQVEKYSGPLTLLPDKECPIVMPAGIEEA